jgi:hypothetical protein
MATQHAQQDPQKHQCDANQQEKVVAMALRDRSAWCSIGLFWLIEAALGVAAFTAATSHRAHV